VITISKTVLSGSATQVRNQTKGLAPARLRDLAVRLAACPELTVSVISYQDGSQELEVLHTGAPRRTEDTVDHRKFAGHPGETLPVSSQDGLHRAVQLVRRTLRDASAA
jgi:hypothetical protein